MVKLFEKLLGGMKMSNEPETTTTNDETKKEEKRIIGKVIKVSSDGYGFISSKEIPFERIFFHWTSLRPDTIKFPQLRSGMKVSFVVFPVEDKGYRAIKIKVEEDSE